MTASRSQDVRRASIRVALTATGAVGVVYVAIAVAVLLIVTHNLTAKTDADLAGVLSHIADQPGGPGGSGDGGGGFGLPPERGPLDPNTVVWTVRSDGSVASNSQLQLPTAYRQVIGPTTATLAGTNVRLEGRAVHAYYVVVGQNMAPVEATQSTIVLAELLIGPILLIAIFLGAVAIGRRVATPIEVARQRQLDFSADASHELRTPLSVIEAHASLALTEERPAAWYRNAFERVSDESKRMRRMLDDLLWLSRFDASQGQPNTEPVDLGVLAEQAVDRFRPIAESRNQRLEVHATDGLVVNAPPDWLDRLLGVLLDNACKYSPQGGLVRVSVAPDGGRIQLAVDDSGPGVRQEERPRIFDRFHRATETGGGAGLGLAIADEIVRATSGRWQLDEARGGGARMGVSWPRGRLGSS
jgi:signal transduction histidine kinase